MAARHAAGIGLTHHTDNGARAAWYAAVTEIAERAKQTLSECNGRFDKAVALVLNGNVELLPNGKARVASQANGTCECALRKQHDNK
jgi:hypothetical protein